MATILGRLSSVHCEALSTFCPLKLLLLCLLFSPPQMVWGAVYEAGACVPSLCLKYAVIAIANALLATGWLVVSVLSVIGELVPKVSQMPPTLPKFPSSPSQELPVVTNKRVQGVRPQLGMPVEAFASRHRTTDDHNVPHRVQFTLSDNNRITPPAVVPTSGYPSSEEKQALSSDSHQTDESKPSEEHRDRREASPPTIAEHDSGDATVRAQRLGFLRKHLSTSHASSKRPASRRADSHGELSTSRCASPARSDHPAAVRGCLKKTRSHDSVAKAVPRTDPYQAPYFFPTPLSPDAVGYTSRIRAERVHSPEQPSRRTTFEASDPVASSSMRADSQVATGSNFSSPPTVAGKARPTRASRRSWHIPFRSGGPEEAERRTSWNSEVTTLLNSHQTQSDSSSRPSSPELTSHKSDRRRNGGRGVANLTPLETLSGAGDLQMLPPPATTPPKLISRKIWHFPFRHRRMDSQDSNSTQPLSEHAVDELPAARARPVMRKTV